MKSKFNILCICNKVKDLKRFLSKENNSSSDARIASDNIKVHQFIKQYHSRLECFFIDKVQQPTHNANAIKFIKRINETFKQSIPNYDELIFLNTSSEGGVTSHKMHQVFNLIEIYSEMISSQYDCIYVYFSPETYIECKIICQICEQRDIPYKAYNKRRFISDYKFKRYTFKNKIFEIYIPYKAFLLLYKIILIITLIKNKYEKYKSFREKNSKNEILFLFKIREDRFISEYENVIDEIQKKFNEMNCKLLLYLSNNHLATINKNYENIERYLFLTDYFVVIKLLKLIKQNFRLIDTSGMEYNGIELDKLIRFDYFLNIELFQTYLLKKATHNYLRFHKPIAIKTWGDSRVDWTKIVKEYYQEIREKPLLFTWFPYGYVSQYDDFEGFDLLFCSSLRQLHQFDQYAMIKKVLISPLKKETAVKCIVQREKIEKRQMLKNILFAVGYISKGRYTLYEAINTIAVLKRLTLKHDLRIQMKCHPGQARELVDDILKIVGLSDKIIVLDSKTNINTLIPEIDLMISPFSTVIYEASVLGKPTILMHFGSINIDDLYGMNNLVNAQSPEELEELLFDIAKDENRYTSWAEERIRQQDLYVKTFFQEETCERKGSEIIAEELLKSVEQFGIN